jgi:magnesium chelatase accessory protein
VTAKRRTRRDGAQSKTQLRPRLARDSHRGAAVSQKERESSRKQTRQYPQMVSSSELSWDREGLDWPNRSSSAFVSAGGLRWHVQKMGSGPSVLLLHGTGASTHSWAALAPLLAKHFTIVAPDLPGHGFTESPPRAALSLPEMARQIGDLLRTLAFDPAMIVGHSAGAAIMIRMTLNGILDPSALVSLNGALLPFGGPASQFFSPLAKLLVLNPLVPRLFAWRASDRAAVERLIRNTGSAIDATGVEYYRRLVSSPRHVGAALAMMANWDLKPLVLDMPKLKIPLLLVAGGEDRAISADQAFQVREHLRSATVEYLRGLGHLAHEEQPEEIARVIADFAVASHVLLDD